MPRKGTGVRDDVRKGAAFVVETLASLALPAGQIAVKGLISASNILRESYLRSRGKRVEQFWTKLLREGIVSEDEQLKPQFEADFATVYQFVLLDEEDAKAEYGAALLASIVRGECDPNYKVQFMKILSTLDIGAIHLLRVLAETWEDSRQTAPGLASELDGRGGANAQEPLDANEINKRVLDEYNLRVAALSSAIWNPQQSNLEPLFLAYRSALSRNGLLPESRQQQGTRPMAQPAELALLFLEAIGVQFLPPDPKSDSRWHRIAPETVLERGLLIQVRRIENGRVTVSRAFTGAKQNGTITFVPGKRTEQLRSFEEYRVLSLTFGPSQATS